MSNDPKAVSTNYRAWVALAILLTGCGQVPIEEITAGQAACEPNGGLKAMYAHLSTKYFQAACANGLQIEGHIKQ